MRVGYINTKPACVAQAACARQCNLQRKLAAAVSEAGSLRCDEFPSPSFLDRRQNGCHGFALRFCPDVALAVQADRKHLSAFVSRVPMASMVWTFAFLLLEFACQRTLLEPRKSDAAGVFIGKPKSFGLRDIAKLIFVHGFEM